MRRRLEAARVGPAEIRCRLEPSYKAWGYGFALGGFLGFLGGIAVGEPFLFLFSGPAFGAGMWLVVNDPREYLVVQPRVRRLQVVRSFGRRETVRREFDLSAAVRLESAQYLKRPRGVRCVLVAFDADGHVEVVDDRVHDALAVEAAARAAQALGLPFIDRGRVDRVLADTSSRLEPEPERVELEMPSH